MQGAGAGSNVLSILSYGLLTTFHAKYSSVCCAEIGLHLDGFLHFFGPNGPFIGSKKVLQTLLRPAYVFQDLFFEEHCCRDAKLNSYGWEGGWVVGLSDNITNSASN